MTKTVLLAGASGLVGGKILEELENNNVKIISLARNKLHFASDVEEIICDFNEIDALNSKIILDEVYIAIGKQLKLYELLYLRKSERAGLKKVDFDFIKSVALFAKKMEQSLLALFLQLVRIINQEIPILRLKVK